MNEALGTMTLVCRWLARDRARRVAPLDAARQELQEAREELDVATSRRDAIFAERAALDRELRRLVRKCDRLDVARERASVERDQAIREREQTLRYLRQAQAALMNPRRDERIGRSVIGSAEPLGVEPDAVVARFLAAIFGPRGAAIAALAAAIAVLLIVLSTH